MLQSAKHVKEYRKKLQKALDNQFLGTTLDNFASAYRTSRENAFEGIDLQHLVEEVAESKEAALPYLEELFAAFRKKAEEAGAKVHVARDAAEANRIIIAIAKENAVRKIVKSKSMTAEEIFLNHHLEKEGLQVTETDLGEWIIQLRGEGPSHMVLPAIHLSRKEVADLFSKVTGEQQDPDDIEGMVKVARWQLRKAFLEADMGISGANFAIADTGTIGLITNEGNGRLVTTLPRVHVALIGFEKLVPDLESALRILKVLPRNATGQIISSYVTWITGANECGAHATGRKEMHIVFLDNGRLQLARDPLFSEALKCIRCGACANVCPIYRLVGGHNYGYVYIGAIGLILTYFYHGAQNAEAIVQNCLNCQACKDVCPAKINLPQLIKNVYRQMLEDKGRRPLTNTVLSTVLKDRKLFHFLLRRASTAQKPLKGKEQFLRHLPFFFGKEHRFRSLPALAPTPLREQWEGLKKEVARPRLRIALFAGCLIDFVYPEQACSLLDLLYHYDVQVEFPGDQTCCGLPAQMMTENEVAKEVAIQNLKAMQPDKIDYILTLCASCGSHLKENMPRLLATEKELAEEVRLFTEKVVDFSSFMMNVLQVSAEDFVGRGRKTAYHAPCHLCRGLKVVHEPRKLMETVGVTYVPTKDEDVCCGFGGSYSFQFPEISAELMRRKLANVEAAHADLLVTDCPGCVMQLRGGAHKLGKKIKVKHIAEAVATERR